MPCWCNGIDGGTLGAGMMRVPWFVGKSPLQLPGRLHSRPPPLRLCLSKGCVVTVCSYLMDQSYFPDGEARPPINPKGTLRWHWERQRELERRERELERWRQWRWEECRREEEAERLHRRWLAAQARALRRVPPPVGS